MLRKGISVCIYIVNIYIHICIYILLKTSKKQRQKRREIFGGNARVAGDGQTDSEFEMHVPNTPPVATAHIFITIVFFLV
jgi:hypothetical protein